MGIEKQTKLNHLMRNWPDGKIKSSVWLNAEGYRANFIQKYKSNNWIEAIGTGAFKKSGDEVTWAAALECLQKQLKSNFTFQLCLFIQAGKASFLFDRTTTLVSFILKY